MRNNVIRAGMEKTALAGACGVKFDPHIFSDTLSQADHLHVMLASIAVTSTSCQCPRRSLTSG